MGSGSSILIVGAVLALLLALLFFGLSLSSRRQARRLAASGVDGEATVLQKDAIRGRNTAYWVRFQLQTPKSGGGTVSNIFQQQVTPKHFQTLTEGMSVPIRYLSANPQRTAALAGVYADQAGIDTLTWTGIGCIVAALICAGLFGSDLIQNSQTVSADAANFAALQAAVQPNLSRWEAAASDDAHQPPSEIPPDSVGLDTGTFGDIYYGYCADNTFYVLATLRANQTTQIDFQHGDFFIYNTLAYESKADNPCTPSGWLLTKRADLSDGWFSSRIGIPMDSYLTPAP